MAIVLLVGCNSTVKEKVDDTQKETIDLINNIKYASVEKASELLTKDDQYTNNLSKFDLKSKVGKNNSTIEDYKNYAANNALEWTKNEKEIIDKNLMEIQNKISELKIDVKYPENLYLIKSSCDEEGGALGYTRSNYIVLKEHSINKKLIAHELFHIISRYNPEKRDEIYNTLGFNYEKIDFPDKLKNNFLTNPDSPELNYVFEAKFSNQKTRKGVLVTYSNKEYTGGSFFEYMNFGFYMLDTKENFKLSDIVDYTKVKNFKSSVGNNTDYIIHPEEISADHFMLLLTKDNISTLPNPELIEKMNEILK